MVGYSVILILSYCRPLEFFFFISQPKHMLWVSRRPFFEHPKNHVKINGQENIHSFMLKMLFTLTYARVKVFRSIPEFRILRLTFRRKSASKC